jgi:hypothetical protein
MSSGPESYPTKISIALSFGRVTIPIGSYQLSAADSIAQAAAIDRAVQSILHHWPAVVYRDQIEALAKGECPCPIPGR